MTRLQKLYDRYESVAMEYITEFCSKHDLDFDGWTGIAIGEIAYFEDGTAFEFSDIRLDIDNDCPKGLILQWYSDSYNNPDKTINYYSYSKGLRFNDI